MEVTATEKAALSLLLKWKDRLRDGNEEQLKNCFENFSEILSENFLTVEDSAPRRSLLFIIEKLTLLCWQDCQYGKKPVLDLYIPFINTAYNEMSKIVSRIQFSRCKLYGYGRLFFPATFCHLCIFILNKNFLCFILSF